MTITARIPELDLSDRCMIAMRRAGLGVSQAAEELRVSRSTISNWINGHTTPRARVLDEHGLIWQRGIRGVIPCRCGSQFDDDDDLGVTERRHIAEAMHARFTITERKAE